MPENLEILNELKKLKGVSTGSASVTVVGTASVTAEPSTVLRVGQITVGATTSKRLTSSCTSKAVGLVAHSANAGKVYFGYNSSVSTSNGFELSVPVSLAIDNANKIYVIASTSGQKVCWVVIR